MNKAYRNEFYCITGKEWNPLPSNFVNMVKTPLFQKALSFNRLD